MNDPEGVKRDIINVATDEFSRKGYSGARVDEIAARTRTSKRMIYYYFGGKEALYVAVLEEAYRRIRRIEETLNLDHLAPVAAVRRLVEFTFDYYNAHPEFVRLVMIENIHNARHMKRSKAIQRLNVTVIDAIRRLYRRGCEAGVFRERLDPIDIHMTISALGIFHVANRATFSTIFKKDMASPAAREARRAEIADIVVRYLRREPAGAQPLTE
ncbi:MAG TPA: TetR family transcriptional regulator [Alphaproteobacteria bacterium]